MTGAGSHEYQWQHRRLALGLDFTDALRGAELVYPVRVERERGLPHESPRPAHRYDFSQLQPLPAGLLRSHSGRYSLSYTAGSGAGIDLRVYDYERRYVPRRLRVPLRSLADVEQIEQDGEQDYLAGRSRNITLFPGANYHHSSGATGMRGRALRNGHPLRWACVEARLPGGSLVARGRGDDRGEFLLLLPPQAFPGSELETGFNIQVWVYGPETAPVPATADLPGRDPLWDLPLEELPAFNLPDDVSGGEQLPAGYVSPVSARRLVSFSPGRILTGRDEPDFDFVIP